MLLVLYVSVFGVGSVSALGTPGRGAGPQSAPARVSTSLGAPSAANIAAPAMRLSTSTKSTTAYYGAPYRDDSYGNQGNSLGEVLAALEASYKSQYGYAFPGCDFDAGVRDPNTDPDHFALVVYYVGSTCGGYTDIGTTAYTFDPGKNTGKPCTCAGDPHRPWYRQRIPGR